MYHERCMLLWLPIELVGIVTSHRSFIFILTCYTPIREITTVVLQTNFKFVFPCAYFCNLISTVILKHADVVMDSMFVHNERMS